MEYKVLVLMEMNFLMKKTLLKFLVKRWMIFKKTVQYKKKILKMYR